MALGRRDEPFAADRRRLWIEWSAAAIFSAVLLLTLIFSGATGRLDDAIYDFSIKLHHLKPRSDVVIVAVDAKSLQEIGPWPWSRATQAELIRKVGLDHPRAMAYDFLVADPGAPADDEALRAAMLTAPTYLGTYRNPAHTERPWITYEPFPQAAKAAAGLGPMDADMDALSVVRRTFLFQGRRGRLVPIAMLQMAQLENMGPDVSRIAYPASGGDDPLYKAGEFLIPFVGPPGTIHRVSAGAVLRGLVPDSTFRGKLVLIGPTAPGLLDTYQTPTSTMDQMPNVEIQANILNGILSGYDFVIAQKWEVFLLSATLIAVLLFALVRLGPRENLLLSVGLAVIPLALSVLGVAFRLFWVPPSSYLTTLVIIVPYWGWRRLNAASLYFAREIRAMEQETGVDALSSRRLPAGGDVVLQQMTVLEDAKRRISDLRRFVDDILANFPDPVLVVDRQGRIARVNGAAEELARELALSVEAGASVTSVLDTISGGAGQTSWPPPDNANRESETPITGIGADNRAYEVRFTPTRDAEGEASGWIVHLADVTPLVSAMRQREEALQLLSHDMRSPQAAIIAILDNPEFKKAPPGLRERIETQARRTLELADSFVRLAQAESARYEFQPIDLTLIVHDAADAVWPLASSASVEVAFAPDDTEYVVCADRRLMTRALINLLDNAVKFSPKGKVVSCRLSIDSLDGNEAVTCEIADSAGGMAQAQLAELFHRFATSREDVSGSQGVGLGLALVHTVVSRHNGRIRCESSEGEGTVFTVTLPIYHEEAVETPSSAAA